MEDKITITELSEKLTEAYSDLNLNKITLTLLTLYKEQQYSSLNKIAELISDFVSIEIDENGKGFSKLIMLYHPDRGDSHRNTIADLTAKGDYDGLLEQSHILKLLRVDEIAELIESYEDIDYSPVYSWDWETKAESYSVITDEPVRERRQKKPQKQRTYSFYDAFRIRIYGNTKTGIPFYYFDDVDEIELSESGIDSLAGIEMCKYAVVVDLSGNQISDLGELWGLTLIEELNLSGNQIELIDTLSNLSSLRHLDLSDNKISDISPLFELAKLESVNLSGNPVNGSQVEELKELGVEVEL
jgi:Leucine-rich repeat (LRR) protein